MRFVSSIVSEKLLSVFLVIFGEGYVKAGFRYVERTQNSIDFGNVRPFADGNAVENENDPEIFCHPDELIVKTFDGVKRERIASEIATDGHHHGLGTKRGKNGADLI